MDSGNDVAEVVELVLTPFRDVLTKARIAAGNAAAEEPSMYKAAETLEREGQRALNRLDPLYKKILNQHGPDFAIAIQRNDDISRFHLELTDALWEFDDYVSVETFNETKYAQLQTLCRSVAPKMYNLLVRMNIELVAQTTAKETALHIVPESPQTSPMYSLSSSTEAWQLSPPQSKTDRDPSLLGIAPWGENSVKSLWIQSDQVTGLQPGDPRNHDAHSASASSIEFANAHVKRQSYSSGHSSGSSGSQSSRGFAPHSITTIHENEERLRPISRYWPLPDRTSSRDMPMIQNSARKTSVSHRVSGEYATDNLRRRVTFEHPAVPPRLPSKHCVITESSSLRRYKGFCSGAQEVLWGNDGVKQKQKPVQRTLSRVVAKCTGCSMELDNVSIETDLSNKDSGSLTKRDVGYRLRFLQKSHLPVKRSTDTLYGCLFCVSNGYTVDESDATVFFSADDLFIHLSRHPRPLPLIFGITVVYGVEMPPNLRNNYDLHLRSPPKTHPVHRESTEIDGRPTGMATKEIRKVEPQRHLVERDRPEELQLAIGAKVTGIKWPPQYKGRRIFAWHDGVFASVLSENIMLVPPETLTFRKSTRSHISGKAKWKFSVKSGKDLPWLKFDKGETITNIGWEHPDHWCWCGTTSKGNWGIFPQAYLDPNTVHDDTAED